MDSLAVLYFSLYLFSKFVLAGTGYVVVTRSVGHHRRTFAGVLGCGIGWLGLETAILFLNTPAAIYTLTLGSDLVALLTVLSVGYFTTVYTGRSISIRKPLNAAALGWLLFGVGSIVSQPVLGLQYASATVRTTPISYLAVEPGPAYLVSVLLATGILLTSVAYLGQLFLGSPHRQGESILLLAVAAGVSVVPTVVSNLDPVSLVPGYDYTVLGVVPFAVVLGYVVFFVGEPDLAPVARKEIVDEIDTALFGLDDAKRIIDYNDAAKELLPPPVDDPVGAHLETVLPDLVAEIEFPSRPGEDVTGTYTTTGDGSQTHFSLSISPISERDTIAGYTVILRDVTAVESSKRQLARQNDRLEAFATTVAHDLRNPLQVATMYTTYLAEDIETADSSVTRSDPVDHLDTASGAFSEMESILSELETLAEHAQSVTDTETIAFEPAVLAAWNRVETGDATITVPTDGVLVAEPSRLSSILETLFRHSADHGGEAVTVELTDTGFDYHDGGLSIPDVSQEEIFAGDVTTGLGTTGLSLTIVQTEARSQGWAVSIDSEGEETRIVFSGIETTSGGSSTDA